MRLTRPWLVSLAGIAAIAAVVFWPVFGVKLVSDTWYHLGVADTRGPLDVLARYLPHPDDWYRPSTQAIYWLSLRLFGTDPTAMHIVSVACHGATTVLIFWLARRLTGDRVAALGAAVVFLFSIHASETVFETADIHVAGGGLFLAASVAAWVAGRRLVAALMAVVSITFAEAGVLVLPLIALYEVVMVARRPDAAWLRTTARRLAPLAIVTVVYVVARFAAGRVFSEMGNTCHAVSCVASGAIEYGDRLLLRGDALLAALPGHRIPITLALAAVVVGMLVILRPWRWPDRRVLLFGLGWAAGGSAFYFLTLWPYISDRFLYIPDMGLALALGATIAAVRVMWSGAGIARRRSFGALGVLLAVWVGVGGWTLADRARGWVAAGDHAATIIEGIASQIGDLPPRSVVLVSDPDGFDDPGFPPGNTGPYVFRNGLREAMQFRLGPDSPIVVINTNYIASGTPLVNLLITGQTVTRTADSVAP